MIIVYTMRVCC